jgi:hypothetical protein
LSFLGGIVVFAVKTVNDPRGVGGWLLVLCLLLLVWQPLSVAVIASSALDALTIRGLPLALTILMRIGVAAVGIAAGLALVKRRPGAVTLAKAALLLSAAADLFVYTTPYFPNNRTPGTTPVYVAATLAYSGVWLLYLWRSKRVRETY